MKLNIKGLVFVGFAAAVFAGAAQAAAPAAGDEGKTVTSYKYTEATYQKKIAAGDNISIREDGKTIDANVGVKGVKEYGANTTLEMDSNGVVTLPQAQTVGTATITVTDGANYTDTFNVNATEGKTITIPVDTNTTYSAGSHTTITGEGNAINVTVDGVIADGNTGIVDGDTVYDYLNSSAVQSDWNQATTTAPDYIKNKPGDFAGSAHGLVPAATSTNANQVLGGNGQWVDQPTVNDGTLTVTQGNSTYTFSANTSNTVSIDIPEAPDIPTPTEGTCTAAAPCALVWAGGTAPVWQAIQQ